MMDNKFLFILFLVVNLISCQNRQLNSDYSSFKRVKLSSKIENVQPMTGIVFFSSSTSAEDFKVLGDAISLEYSYLLYNDVVKDEGVYDWTSTDSLLNAVASRKNQAILRFRDTYPGRPSTIPDYIKARDDYEILWGKSENRDTEFPDWRCPELRRFHTEFHKRFAERYDNDPRLAFVQTGFGLWGEYHLYDGPYIEGQTFPSKQYQGEFIRALGEFFEYTTWSISIDSSPLQQWGPFAEENNKNLINERFGLFDDSFMHETHDKTNETWWNAMNYKERYKIAPMGGEFGYYTREDQANVLNREGMHGRIFENEAAKFHLTYMKGNAQLRYQTVERIKEASMACGYRFTIEDFRVRGNKSAVLIKNSGVAPIYRKAYVAVNGIRGEQSLHTLYPDESIWIEVTSGGKSPTLAIECDHLVPGQKIEYEADVN